MSFSVIFSTGVLVFLLLYRLSKDIFADKYPLCSFIPVPDIINKNPTTNNTINK